MSAAPATQPDLRFVWSDYQAIADQPEVYEAIRALLDDHTEDNAACMVRQVVEAAAERLGQLASQDHRQHRAAVMGQGRVALGLTRDQASGAYGITYLDLGEQREIDADTSDLFGPGYTPAPSQVLARIDFLTAASVDQTIAELAELKRIAFGEQALHVREPLSEAQIEALFRSVDSEDKGRYTVVRAFARAIERAHRIPTESA